MRQWEVKEVKLGPLLAFGVRVLVSRRVAGSNPAAASSLFLILRHLLNNHNLLGCRLHGPRLHDGSGKPNLYPLLVFQCCKGCITEIITILLENQRFVFYGDGVFSNNLVSM
jgi:hypothetical protein